MRQDGTPTYPTPHPAWCDQTTCTITEPRPYGHHQSASQVIPADPPIDVVAELHLASTMPGLSPHTLLLLELCTGDDATVVPLTLHQARQLHAALDKLLTASRA